jgi:hypothetical protein
LKTVKSEVKVLGKIGWGERKTNETDMRIMVNTYDNAYFGDY